MDLERTVAEMTLEEKTSLLSGRDSWHTKSVERLGIPSITVADGPHGLRKETDGGLLGKGSEEAVCFPSAAGIAASFDRELIKSVGDTLGKECLAKDVRILLGPAINIKRSPLCGRNFEYLSEDPYLAGELAAAYVAGVQQNGVGVSVKHFAANNQETRRMTVSAEIDRRTLREIYLSAFEKTVKASKPMTLMCSYNRINGVYSSENRRLLTDDLRVRWGFTGFVMSDWGAVNDRAAGVKAGLELEMPGSGGVNDRAVAEAVREGILDETVVDEAVKRILSVVLTTAGAGAAIPELDLEADRAKAAEAALSSMVLLKNDGILPLRKEQKVALIGEFALKPRYQGGGSSHVNAHRVAGAAEVLKDNRNVTFARGYDTKLDREDAALVSEAVAAAKKAEIAVVFLGLPDRYESEGYDRDTIDLPGYQNALLEAVLKAQDNVVVVLHNGSPVAMPWVGSVRAVLESYLAGEGAGDAQAKLLYGEANPSGKLAETFPIALEDVPSSAHFPGKLKTVEYREGLYVGYRYFRTAKKPVLFPFGHGLSYTTFEYSDLRIEGEFPFTARFKVKNTGTRAGAEIAELYVKAGKKTEYRPEIELKGFEKVYLEPGAETEISIALGEEAFRAFNAEADDWYVEGGGYEIKIGASSEDVRLSAAVTVPESGVVPKKKELPHYFACDLAAIPDAEFETLLGRPLSPSSREKDAPITAADTMSDAAETKWGRRILRLARRFVRGNEMLNADMVYYGFADLPIGHYMAMTGGRIGASAIRGLLDLLNGKGFFRPAGKILKGVLTKK